MGFIYKIENNINHKIYIGLTTRTILQRWGQHKTECKRTDKYPNNKFYSALRKYGVDNFTVSQVEEANNEILPEREQYWIAYYNTYYDGYNSDFGGGTGDVGDCVNQYDVCGNYIQSFKSASEAERIMTGKKTVSGTVATAARLGHSSKTAYGYQWRYSKDYPIGINIDHIPVNSQCQKPVDQYDLEGNYIASYLTIKEAAEAVKSNPTSIKDCCVKKVRQAANYQWRFAWDENPGKVPVGKKYSNFNRYEVK